MIVTYEEAAEFLKDPPLADDETFRDTCDFADGFVKNYCQRKFEYGTYTEVLPGTGGNFILLTEDPIESVDAVYIDWAGEFPPESQLLSLGQIHMEGRRLIYENGWLPQPNPFWGAQVIGPTGDQVVKVVYKAGYYPVTETDAAKPKMPRDLRFAVKKIVAIEQRRGASSELFQSESLGDRSYNRGGSAAGEYGVVPYDARVMQTLDFYKRY
jgi:hypothetical protein